MNRWMALTLLLALPPTLTASGNAQTLRDWTLRTLSNHPAARSYMGMTYDLARRQVILFGGFDLYRCLGDTWVYDGNRWRQLHPRNSPPARCCHRLVYDMRRARVVLFGGAAGTAAKVDLNDTWEWDGTNWLNRTPAKGNPSPRREATLAYDWASQRVVLFGGGQNGGLLFNDTWEWDGSTWTAVPTQPAPPHRWCSACTPEPGGGLVLFGGRDNKGPLGDTWRWKGKAWTRLAPTTSPPPRSGPAGVLDILRGRVILGGLGNTATPTTDTWEWDKVNWARVQTPTQPTRAYALGLAFDLHRNRVVRFGGYGPMILAQTWEYSGYPAAAYSSIGSGCRASWGQPLLEPSGGQLPLTGKAYTLTLAPLVGSPSSVGVLGFSTSRWGTVALPHDLGNYGMPGCSLRTAIATVTPLVPTAGQATWTLPLPSAPFLLGRSFHQQAFTLDPKANRLGLVASNGMTGTIGH